MMNFNTKFDIKELVKITNGEHKGMAGYVNEIRFNGYLRYSVFLRIQEILVLGLSEDDLVSL